MRKFVPYMVIGEDLQVCHTCYPYPLKAYFEQPASIYGFKMAQVILPTSKKS